MELRVEKPERIIISARAPLLPEPEVTWTHRWLHEVLSTIPVDVVSLIDVGCGKGVMGALVRIYRSSKRLVGIDAFKPYLDFCREMNFYDELYKYDLRQTPLPFNDKEFDVATCIEVIEHLPKNEGMTLLNELERMAKTVIVTTPNVSFSQNTYDGNPFQQHASTWSVKDFTERGYRVRGVGDLLFFGHRLKHLSFFLSKFSYVMPNFSDTLLAYKTCDETQY